MIATKALRLLVVAALGAVLLYVSPFWVFELWGREGLLGWSALPPQGDLLARWLRGTPLAPLELIIWATAVFLTATLVQRLLDRFS